jgi:hypothetical protein
MSPQNKRRERRRIRARKMGSRSLKGFTSILKDFFGHKLVKTCQKLVVMMYQAILLLQNLCVSETKFESLPGVAS